MKEKKHWIALFVPAILLTALLTGCSLRPRGVETDAPEDGQPASATPAPNVTYHTVTYLFEGDVIGTEQVPEGESPQQVPERMDSRGIVAWENTNGTETDVWTAKIAGDTEFSAVTGPELTLTGGYLDGESDGLFHPYNEFTRSDAARAVYALLAEKPTGETFLKDVTTHARCWQAATTLVTEGYMTLDDGHFYPDAAITPADLETVLGKLFSPGAVRQALSEMGETMTRAQAVTAINRLLGLDQGDRSPYFPDVSPDTEFYQAVELAGKETWEGAHAQPGFELQEGYLYRVGDDGYFLHDAMVGTLYFDITGQYTSGDATLDKYVADILDAQITDDMDREEMLRTVYEYVRDHYLYLKRNIYAVGETGWEVPEALTMFETGKGNCYNFTSAFWALARGVGYDAVCYSGLVGVGRDPHSWVEIEFDGAPYIFDVETEMQNRLNDDYYTSMYKMTYDRGALWSYAREPYPDEG